MAARLVFIDRQGRPRVIAEAFLRQGGAIGLSLRVLDREGAPRVLGALFVRRDGTGELAVVVLDRRGTARAAWGFFLREDGALVVVVIAIGRPAAFPALPSADMREVFGIGAFSASPSPASCSARPDGWLLHLLHAPVLGVNGPPRIPILNAVVVRLDAPPRFPLIGAVVVRLDGPARLPLIGAAFLVHDARFLFLAAAALGNGGLRLLTLPAAALGVDRLVVFFSAAADSLVGAIFVHRDGTGELAVVVLDRRGTARAAWGFFLREDGALVVVVIAIGRPAAFPALPSADMREVFGIGAFSASPSPASCSARPDGWLLHLLHAPVLGVNGPPRIPILNAVVVRLDAPPRFPLIGAVVVRLDGLARLPLIGAAFLVHDARFLFLAAAALGNGGLRLLTLPAAALGVDRLVVFFSAAADSLVGAIFVHRDGTGELAVVALDRRGTARAASAWLLLEDSTLVVFVGFDRAGARGLFVINFPALPSADVHEFFGIGVQQRPQPLLPLRAAALALAPPATVDGWLLRLLPLPSAAPGFDGMLGFLAAPADGLDWRRRFRFIDPAVFGHDEPPRLLPAAAVAADVDGPRLPLLAAQVGVDLDGIHRPLLPPLPGPPRGIARPLIPAAARATPPMDDRTLQFLEEGRLVPPNARATLVPMLFRILEEMEKDNPDESTITEAAITLITELLSHMSERARRHIISRPAFSPMDHQQNNPGRMRRSFLTTVGLSVTSNMSMYFLSVGLNMLDGSEEGSMQSAGPPSREQWVMKFIAWLAERIVAPVLLTSLVLWVREDIIGNEMHLMHYEDNGISNVLINGLSRAFFLAIRGFPGISQPDLWARLASVFIEFIGAAFLYWMGGFWDPDTPDVT